jgi:hypothetical protein
MTSRASVARWALAIVIAVAAVELVVVIFAASQLGDSHKEIVDGRRQWVPHLALERLLPYRPWHTVTLPCILIAAITWMAWQHAAHRELADLDDTFSATHPRSRVWWWLVPGANLVMPYRSVRDLFHGSAGTNGEGASSTLLLWWWVTWWLGFGCTVAGVFLLLRIHPGYFERWPGWTVTALCWRDVLLITSAALATVGDRTDHTAVDVRGALAEGGRDDRPAPGADPTMGAVARRKLKTPRPV